MVNDGAKKIIIDASPTKELFINVLTKDISLKDCILDLLDNSVDSYIRMEIPDRRQIKINKLCVSLRFSKAEM